MHFDSQYHGDTVFFLGRGTDNSLAAALLHPIYGRIHSLDVSIFGQSDNRLLVRDDIFLFKLTDSSLDDLRPTLIAELVPYFDQFALYQPENFRPMLQKILQVSDQFQFLFKFILDFLPFESGEGLQAHFKNSGRLSLRKTEFFHQIHVRLLFRRGLLDSFDNGIDMVESRLQSLKNMGPILGFLKLILRSSSHDRLTVLDIVFKNRLEIQHLRIHPIHQRQHIHIEILLQVRHGIKRVQDLLRIRVLLQLDDDPYALLIRFVPQIFDSDNLLFLDQIRDLHDQGGLIRLIGHFRHDDLETPCFRFDDIDPRPRDDRALSGRISMMNIAAVVHDATGRKIRTLDEAHKLIDGRIRLIDQVTDTVH